MKSSYDVRNTVRAARRAADMTQEELAQRVGVTRQSIVSIERGRYNPSVGLALAIAEALDARVEDLFELAKGDGHE